MSAAAPDGSPNDPAADRPGPPAGPPRDPGSGPEPAADPRSDDDRDLGWGDDLDRAAHGDRDARWYEEQRPPHWE